jgi:hypothetical protein
MVVVAQHRPPAISQVYAGRGAVGVFRPSPLSRP